MMLLEVFMCSSRWITWPAEALAPEPIVVYR
jgi:hypothetical protein